MKNFCKCGHPYQNPNLWGKVCIKCYALIPGTIDAVATNRRIDGQCKETIREILQKKLTKEIGSS